MDRTFSQAAVGIDPRNAFTWWRSVGGVLLSVFQCRAWGAHDMNEVIGIDIERIKEFDFDQGFQRVAQLLAEFVQ